MGLRRSFRPTNLVTNGNFANGTTGWKTSHLSSSMTVYNNTAIVQAINNTRKRVYLYSSGSFLCNLGNLYYLRGTSRVRDSAARSINLEFILSANGYRGIAIAIYPQQDKWYHTSGVIAATGTVTASGAANTSCFAVYPDGDTANGKVLEVQDLLIIDLTATFGAGNEPDKAWCDLNIPNWFDGTLGGGVINGTGGLK